MVFGCCHLFLLAVIYSSFSHLVPHLLLSLVNDFINIIVTTINTI